MTNDEAIRAVRAEMTKTTSSSPEYKLWQAILLGLAGAEFFNIELAKEILFSKGGTIA